MPNTDPSASQTPPSRPRVQPSLLGAADAGARAGSAGDGGLRMLDELDSSARPKAATTAPASGRGAGLLLGLVLMVGALAWWARSEAPAARSADAPGAVGRSEAKPVAPALASVTAPATAVPAEAATARIENAAPGAAMAQAVAATQMALAAPAPTVTRLGPLPARDAGKPAAKPAAKIGTTRTSVAPARADEPALANPAAGTAGARSSKNADADVVLLTALLAHVSRSGQTDTLAEQDQMTIAQIVQRCEARGGDEAHECRRRICEGYWGKADACPMPAVPAAKKG